MIRKNEYYAYVAVVFSFIIALALSEIPIGMNLTWFKPDWVVLLLIYWVAFCPRYVGLGTGFIVGLFLDLLNGSPLGLTGFALAVVAFLTNAMRDRLRTFRVDSQALTLLVVIGVYQLLILWGQILVGHPPLSLQYWCVTMMSTLFWPLIYFVMSRYQQILSIR